MLWGSKDLSNNSPIYVSQQFNRGVSTDERDALFGNTTANVYVQGETVGVFGVDKTEQQALSGNTASGAHAGWVVRHVGQGGRAGRVFIETLVAMGSMSTDAADDAIFKDYRIVILTNPANSLTWRGNTVNLTVVANTVPVGGSLTYYWQKDGGPGVLTWANVANTAPYASANGITSKTLSISNNFTIFGNTHRVVISVAGGTNIISANANVTYFSTLTINSQPQNSEETVGNAVNLIVRANSFPRGLDLTYKWQVDGGPDVEAWSDVANTGLFASANGNTTTTLSISDNTTLEDNVFRVLISTAAANKPTNSPLASANATITFLA